MNNSSLIAVDLAKSVFEIAVSPEPGKVSQRARLTRQKFLGFFVNRPPATVVMEACGSAHYWGRELEALGHRVVLLPPHQVRPYVTRNKTDRTDTKGLLEAYRNEDLHPVPVKSVEQQVLGSLHRLRAAWMAERTALINTVRGLLRELGVVIPAGAKHVVPTVATLVTETGSALPEALRTAFAAVSQQLRPIETRIAEIDRQLAALAEQSPAVQRLLTVPGIGLLTATALVACVGDIRRFPSARHFASYLGLTPREHSSGPRRHLGAISKQGDAYLRMLLCHGARSVLFHARHLEHPDRLRAWAQGLEPRVGHNKATVALAHKLARLAWAVWFHDCDFDPRAGDRRGRTPAPAPAPTDTPRPAAAPGSRQGPRRPRPGPPTLDASAGA